MADCLGCSSSLKRGKYCGDCHSLYHSQYRADHKEKANTYAKSRREHDKEAARARDREYRIANLETIRANDRKRHARDKTLRLEKALAYANSHKEEKAVYDEAYRIANEKKLFSRFLKRAYKITIEEYMELYNKQNSVCAICGQPEKAIHSKTGKVKRLSVDHCHTTGVVRGLLCGTCNAGIGQLNDSCELLERALNYLRSSQITHFPH